LVVSDNHSARGYGGRGDDRSGPDFAVEIVSPGDRIVFVTGTNFYPLAHNLLVIHEVG
jgi:hypothetical protein